jgi:O-antigen/teichoic acid export membrane protein
MVSTETTAETGIDRSETGPVPWRRLLEHAFHTLLPSAVRMIGAGFQFLSTVMVARALGDGPSAPFFFWSSVLMTSGPIATYGLEQIALRTVPRLESEGVGAVARFIARLRGLSLAVSLLLGLGWMIYAIATEPSPGGFRFWHLLPLFAQSSIALTLINGEALKGLSRPVLGSVFGHVLPVGIFCLLVAAFARHSDAITILAFYTGSFLLGAALARFAPGGNTGNQFLLFPDRKLLAGLLREGFPICCVSLFGALGFIVPLAICESLLPAAVVSHLTAAFRISILFIVLSGAIHGVFAPALSRSAAEPSPLRPVLRVYGKSIGIALLVLGLPLAIGILFPGTVMSVFGEEFRDGAAALRWLLFVQFLSLLMGPVPHLLLMTGHTVFLARIGIVKFALVTLLSILLVPRLGGTGMVAAMGIAFLGEGLAGVAYALLKMRRLSGSSEAGTA